MLYFKDIVTQVDSIQLSSNTILLASAGQDSIVRIWRLEPAPPPDNGNGTLDVQDKDLEVKDLLLVYPSEDVYSVKLESVLCGHEDKVFILTNKNFFLANFEFLI